MVWGENSDRCGLFHYRLLRQQDGTLAKQPSVFVSEKIWEIFARLTLLVYVAQWNKLMSEWTVPVREEVRRRGNPLLTQSAILPPLVCPHPSFPLVIPAK